MKSILKILLRLQYFFPFKLLLEHFKRHQILLIFWLLIFGFITGNLASGFGIHTLLLSPEYLDNNGFWAFLLLGITTGSFIVAYNLAFYIATSYRYPFLATLQHPFLKFAINNILFPLLYIIVFTIESINFQIINEFESIFTALFNILGFYFGILIFIFFAFTFFFSTNKDLFKMFGITKEKFKDFKLSRPLQNLVTSDLNWKINNAPDGIGKTSRVELYFSYFFKIKMASNYNFYPKEMIYKVLGQNPSNGAVFGFLIIFITLVLGIFMDTPAFMLPAGASIMLLLTIILMIASAIHTILKQWSITVFIIALFAINIISKHSFLNYQQSGYGMTYNEEKYLEIDSLAQPKTFIYDEDFHATIKILEKWRKKNRNKKQWKNKPKMVLISTKGGGLKAAIWTYYSLAHADSVTNGKLLSHTQLITGASGGMIGAAYLRELYLQYINNQRNSYFSDSLLAILSKDVLNPIAFSFTSRDWFFRIRKFEYQNKKYYRDRAFAFENRLNQNTLNILDKPLIAYKKPEKDAQIPMLFLTPTIIDDGRKLLISPLDISYMLNRYDSQLSSVYKLSPHSQGIEFRRLYKDYNADSLRFLTALRMNATFPYISPMVGLPGTPELRVMDAALHDNYGLSTTLHFLFTFREWIEKNTGGVIIIQISDKNFYGNPANSTDSIISTFFNQTPGLIQQLVEPFGNIYSNLFNYQKINNDRLAGFAKQIMQDRIEFINLFLYERDMEISLSWHLSEREKRKIKNSIYLPENQAALARLKILLEEN